MLLMLERIGETDQEMRETIKASFIEQAQMSTSKRARPDYLRFVIASKTFQRLILMVALK
jgi:hypothetical protein